MGTTTISSSLHIHEAFAARVREQPQDPAVSFLGEKATTHQSLTYRELDDAAESVAQLLVDLGVPCEGLVGVRMSRCVGMVVALMGVLKAGAAYVPIDPTYPSGKYTSLIIIIGSAQIM